MPRNASRKRKKSKNRPNNKNNPTSIGQGTSSAPSSGLTSPTTKSTTTTLTTSLTSEVPDSSAVAVKNLLLQDLAKLVQQKCVLEVAILYLLIQNEIVMANSWRFGDLGKSLVNFLVGGGSNTNLNQNSASSTRPPRYQEIPEYFQPRPNETSTPQTVPRKKKGGGGKNGNNSKSSSETSSLTSLSNVPPQSETSLTKPTPTPKKSNLATPKLKQSEAVTAITQDITTVTASTKKHAKVNHQQTNPAKAAKQTYYSDSIGNKAKDVTLVTEGVVTKIPRAAKFNEYEGEAITLVSKELPHNSVIVTEAVPLVLAAENVVIPPLEDLKPILSSSVPKVQPSRNLVESQEEIVFLRRQQQQNVRVCKEFLFLFCSGNNGAENWLFTFSRFLASNLTNYFVNYFRGPKVRKKCKNIIITLVVLYVLKNSQNPRAQGKNKLMQTLSCRLSANLTKYLLPPKMLLPLRKALLLHEILCF